MLSSKLNVLSHNSVPSGQICKSHSQAGGSFFQTIVLSTYNCMLSLKLNILSHSPVPCCQIWILPSQTGFFLGNHFEYHQSYVVFKIEHFIQYFFLSQYYLLYVYISHIFKFSSAILIALNDDLELTILCIFGDFVKRLNWYVFLLTTIGQFHFLLWTLFLIFFTYMPDICSWGTNYTYLWLLPSEVFVTIWVPKWGQFGGQLWICILLQIYVWVITFWPKSRVHSISGSSPIYVSP